MTETQWDGIVVRCTTGETGKVPRTVKASSPDIICNGKVPLPDPSILAEPGNYNNAYSNNVQEGAANFLYVRGKNFTEGMLAGSWNLFYAPSNILLYPYLWEKNQLATSGGNKSPAFTIDAGMIGASEDSFVWVPEAPPSGSHYCLIAAANTPDHGNPVSGLNTITGLAEYLANNGNFAQRNTNLQTGNIPDFADVTNYEQGSEGSLVDIATVFSNIPKGSNYTVACGTPVDGKTLSHSEASTTDNDFKYAWTSINMPANWSGLFNYSLKFGSDWSGIPAGKHPTVQVRGELVQGSSDPLYHLGREADPHPITGKKRLNELGNPVRIITVGTYQTVCPDVNPNK